MAHPGPSHPLPEGESSPSLTLVQGEAESTASREVGRWKSWVAVLLAVILVLVTIHIGPL
ncbi:MAG: hypothetical protein MH204_06660 [Fimbriimonadaceae bacterium]|nr:hypothetical protein [Fimbriimonadaceae bacterium]